MLAPWAKEEMKTAKLTDKRLNERLATVLRSWRRNRPRAFPRPAAVRPRWRRRIAFLKMSGSFRGRFQPQSDATRHRAAEQPVVILPQDTTESDSTRPEQEVAGAVRWMAASDEGRSCTRSVPYAGRRAPGNRRRVGLDPSGRAALVGCGAPGATQAAPDRRKGKSAPDSPRSRRGEELAPEAGHPLICVADSEADIYETLAEAKAEPGPWTGSCGLPEIAHCKRRGKRGIGGTVACRGDGVQSVVQKTSRFAGENRRSLAPRGRANRVMRVKPTWCLRGASTLHPPYRRTANCPR